MASDRNMDGNPMYKLLKDSSVSHIVEMAHSPSSQFYMALLPWLEDPTNALLVHTFYHTGGLRALLDTINQLSSPLVTTKTPLAPGTTTGASSGAMVISDAVLLLDCLACLQGALRSRDAMETMLGMGDEEEEDVGSNKLVMGIDCPNVHVKKLVVELLTVVCLYNQRGQIQITQALSYFKKRKRVPHDLSVLCGELKLSQAPGYRTALLGLINSIIHTHDDLKARCRIRQKFIGLGLLDTIHHLRLEIKDEAEAEMAVQLETFDSHKHRDDAELARLNPRGPDLTSPIELSNAIADRVYASPQATDFLHVMQDLYALDMRKVDRTMLWSTLALTTQHIANLKDLAEAESFLSKLRELLEPPETSSKTMHEEQPVENSIHYVGNGISDIPDIDSEVFLNHDVILSASPDMKSKHDDRRDSGISVGSRNRDSGICLSLTSPLSPYDNVNFGNGFVRQRSKRESGRSQRKLTLDTVPEDGMAKIETKEAQSVPPAKQRPGTPTVENSQKQPSFIKPSSAARPKTLSLLHENGVEEDEEEEEEEEEGKGGNKRTKTVKWVNLPDQRVNGGMSIWKEDRSTPSTPSINYAALTEEFKENAPLDGSALRSADDEVYLLDHRVGLAVTLWVRRHDGDSVESLVEALVEGDTAELTVDSLKQLVKVMPSVLEVQQVASYPGSVYELGTAEQFVSLLHHSCPHWSVLLSGLLLRSEHKAGGERHLSPGTEAQVRTARELLRHEGLKQFLAVLKAAGNKLNEHAHTGGTGGVSLSTLMRCQDVKGQQHHCNLLSWVTHEVEKSDEHMLSFVNDLVSLEQAARHNGEATRTAVKELKGRVNTLEGRLVSTDDKLRAMFRDFITSIKKEVAELDGLLELLKGLSNQLAVYFCEEPATFDLQGCFKHINELVSMVRRCQKGGYLYRKQSRLAEKKVEDLTTRVQHDQHLRKFGNQANCCSSMMYPPTQEDIVKHVLEQVVRGNTYDFYDNDSKNNSVGTPSDNKQGLSMSCILDEEDEERDNRLPPSTPLATPLLTPEGELELSLDVDGLVLQPSPLSSDAANDDPFLLDDFGGDAMDLDPKLLYDFKVAISKPKAPGGGAVVASHGVAGRKLHDHLMQSTPIAGNLRGMNDMEHMNKVKKCLVPSVSPVTSPPRFTETEEHNNQKQGRRITLTEEKKTEKTEEKNTESGMAESTELKETNKIVPSKKAKENAHIVKDGDLKEDAAATVQTVKEEFKPVEEVCLEVQHVQETKANVQASKAHTQQKVQKSADVKSDNGAVELNPRPTGMKSAEATPLAVQIPAGVTPTRAEPEDLSPLSEACFNVLEDEGGLAVQTPAADKKVQLKKERSPESFQIKFYPKYDFNKSTSKQQKQPDVMEINKERRQSINKGTSEPIYKNRAEIDDSLGGRGILRANRGRQSNRLVKSGADQIKPDQKGDPLEPDQVGVLKHKSSPSKTGSQRPVSYPASPSKPVQSGSQIDKPVLSGSGIARYGLKPTELGTRRHISPPSTLSSLSNNNNPSGGFSSNLPRANSSTKLGLQRSTAAGIKPPVFKPVTKIAQPQMGKLALKCGGSDGSVHQQQRGGSAERKLNSQDLEGPQQQQQQTTQDITHYEEVPHSNNHHHHNPQFKEVAVDCEEAVPVKKQHPSSSSSSSSSSPPLAEIDTMDALDLSSSVVPSSPDLQTKVLTAVHQREQEAEAARKLKAEQEHQHKKKSNFGLFRRFTKAFKSTREDPRSSSAPRFPPEVIENPSAVRDPKLGVFNDDSENSMINPVSRAPSFKVQEGTELSDSFVMVKPMSKMESGKGLRRFRNSGSNITGKKEVAKSSMVVSASKDFSPLLQLEKSPLKSSVSDPGRDKQRQLPPSQQHQQQPQQQQQGAIEKRASNQLQPRSSKSLPAGNPGLSQLQMPQSRTPRSSSLPTKPVETGFLWQRKSGSHLIPDDMSESGSSVSTESQDSSRPRSYSSSASRSNLPHRNSSGSSNKNLSNSQTSIASKSSGNSADGGSSRYRRLSSEGKKPRLAGTRNALAPEVDRLSHQVQPQPQNKEQSHSRFGKPSKLQAPKTANQPQAAPRLEYRPNPIKPLAYRDHNKTARVAPETVSTKFTRLPMTAGKENSGKGDGPSNAAMSLASSITVSGSGTRLQMPSRTTSHPIRETVVL